MPLRSLTSGRSGNRSRIAAIALLYWPGSSPAVSVSSSADGHRSSHGSAIGMISDRLLTQMSRLEPGPTSGVQSPHNSVRSPWMQSPLAMGVAAQDLGQLVVQAGAAPDVGVQRGQRAARLVMALVRVGHRPGQGQRVTGTSVRL